MRNLINGSHSPLAAFGERIRRTLESVEEEEYEIPCDEREYTREEFTGLLNASRDTGERLQVVPDYPNYISNSGLYYWQTTTSQRTIVTPALPYVQTTSHPTFSEIYKDAIDEFLEETFLANSFVPSLDDLYPGYICYLKSEESPWEPTVLTALDLLTLNEDEGLKIRTPKLTPDELTKNFWTREDTEHHLFTSYRYSRNEFQLSVSFVNSSAWLYVASRGESNIVYFQSINDINQAMKLMTKK